MTMKSRNSNNHDRIKARQVAALERFSIMSAEEWEASPRKSETYALYVARKNTELDTLAQVVLRG